MAAVLLAHEHHERRAVGAGGRERGHGVAEPGRGVQQGKRGGPAADGVSSRHRDHGALVQAEYEAQVLGESREERHLGRPWVGEDRRELEPAQHVERCVAHRVMGHGAKPTAKRLDFYRADRRFEYHGAMATSPERPRPQYRRSASGASEEIAVQIRRWLEEQRMEPGERIGTEQEMADEFGVSRPTLREALRLLSASHLIRVGRGRTGGVFVASTPNEGMSRNVSESISLMLAAQSISMDELLDARLSLEVPIAGRAAANATDEVADRLEAAIEAAVGHRPGTPPFNEADTRFHQILAETAGNDLLRALTAWILEVLQPTLVAHISVKVEADAIFAQHRAILRAVRRRQRGAAEKAMQAHIEYLAGVLREIDGR